MAHSMAECCHATVVWELMQGIWIREPPSLPPPRGFSMYLVCLGMAAGLPEHPQSKCSKREGQNSQNMLPPHCRSWEVTRSSQPRGGKIDPPLDVWSHIKEGISHLILQCPRSQSTAEEGEESSGGSQKEPKHTEPRAGTEAALLNDPVLFPPGHWAEVGLR